MDAHPFAVLESSISIARFVTPPNEPVGGAFFR
jgi:hypothetical protein